jgi:hypothetical protein
MGKKSAPPPPDYAAAAEATAAGNREMLEMQTRANRPNQTTPWGTSTWSEGKDGMWEQRIELTPQQQAALEDQQNIQAGRSGLALSLLDRAGGEFADPMDWDQFGEYTSDLSSGAEARAAAEEASYNQAASRLDPRFSQRREEMDAGLRAQGLRPGDEAYDRAMGNLGRDENDAYNQAMYSAILTGGAEGQREQAMDLAAGSFGNQVRAANVGEEMQRRGFSLNEINSILTGQQVNMPSMPGFNSAGFTPGPDYMSAANLGYQGQLDQFSAENAWKNSLMSGVGGLAMAFA